MMNLLSSFLSLTQQQQLLLLLFSCISLLLVVFSLLLLVATYARAQRLRFLQKLKNGSDPLTKRPKGFYLYETGERHRLTPKPPKNDA